MSSVLRKLSVEQIQKLEEQIKKHKALDPMNFVAQQHITLQGNDTEAFKKYCEIISKDCDKHVRLLRKMITAVEKNYAMLMESKDCLACDGKGFHVYHFHAIYGPESETVDCECCEGGKLGTTKK